MQIKFNEKGRSMVEMLVVLAIIGVLSVGDIIGYKYGMMKYRVNETIMS
ncbi:MAG: prepilin-type N-terminal cleavage/methylation domain-containing protein [Alphaproteobacteria bacterium]|nr:prepilin-type N-terminal cleavage/methylation domain-containing protein [Alphaproteobacteria bacterium]